MIEFDWQVQKFVLNGRDITHSIPLNPNTGLVQNSQCIVDTSGLSLTPAGPNGVILTVPLSFKSTFTGAGNVYLLGLSSSNPRGWEVQGTFTVPLATSVTLTASPNPSQLGQAVTLTATPASGTTGLATFYDGTDVLGTSTVASGAATLTTTLLPAGSRKLTAYYHDGSIAGTSNTVTQVVNAAPAAGFAPAPSVSLGPVIPLLFAGDFDGDRSEE